MRGEKGITLVALVVTIVVLLILAGVTITYVLSDTGILNRANHLSKDAEMAAIRDYASNAVMDLRIESYANVTGSNAITFAEDTKGTASTAQRPDGYAIIRSNFPDGYTVNFGSSVFTYTPATQALTGSATVTVNSHNYTVDFSNITVTEAAE